MGASFDPMIALAFANGLLPLLGALYLAAYFWGLGVALEVILRFPESIRRRPAHRTFLLGIAGASVTLLLFGAAGFLARPFFLAWSFLFVAGGAIHPPNWKESWRRISSGSLGEKLAFAFLAAIAGVATLGSLIPDTSWDSLSYHLAMGKLFVQSGKIMALPWMSHSNFPVATDLLFLHGLLLGGDRLAVPVNVILAAAAAAAAFGLARRWLDPAPSLLVTSMFFLLPETGSWIGTCYVEIGWTAFATGSLVAALEGLRQRDDGEVSWPWFTSSGIFAGLAAGTKIAGLASLAGVGLIIFLRASKPDSSSRSRFAPFAGFSGGSLLALAPFYLKTYFHTGTPVWPLSLRIFTVRNWNDHVGRLFESFHKQMWSPIESPLADLIPGTWVFIRDLHDVNVTLVVMFVLAFFLAGRRVWHELWPVALFVGAHFAFWGFVTQQSRFLMAAAPAALAGLAFILLGRENTRRFRRILFGVAAAAVVAAGASVWTDKLAKVGNEALPIAVGKMEREHPRESDPLYRIARRFESSTPPGRKILLLSETRGYYFDHEYIWGNPINQAIVSYPDLATANDLRWRLHELGVTHLLSMSPTYFLEKYYDFHTASIIQELAVRSRLVMTEGPYAIFDLTLPAAPDATRPAVVSSTFRGARFPPEGVIDGRIDAGSWGKGGGWSSTGKPSPDHPEQLLFLFPHPQTLDGFLLHGFPDPSHSLRRFRFQFGRDGTWIDIPETRVGSGSATAWRFTFEPVWTDRIRLVIEDAAGDEARVMELSIRIASQSRAPLRDD